jgi:glycosyltransferase involved in cell wall biosynthesis
VNPYSVDQIATAMYQIKFDPQLRKSLIQKGKIQRRKFTWDQTSIQLWASIEKVLATLS